MYITRTQLPEAIKNLECLTALQISLFARLERLPESIRKAEGVGEGFCVESYGLTELPANFGHFASLRKLHLSNFRQLKTLPPSFGALSGLHELTTEECWFLEELPHSIRQLNSLRTLASQPYKSQDTTLDFRGTPTATAANVSTL